MTQLLELEAVLPGVHAFAPEPLPFDPSIHIRAFLLEREHGNVLVYSSSTVAAEADAVRALGGISRQYLNHRHEGGFGAGEAGAPLFFHEQERHAVAARPRGTFSRRHTLDHDFEVIPTPGHTAGATAYLWDSGEHRFLFTGDTIWLHDGEWVAAVLDTSDRGAYVESLDLVRSLDFDVLVPWAAGAHQQFHALTDAADARRRIGAILDRIWRGGSR